MKAIYKTILCAILVGIFSCNSSAYKKDAEKKPAVMKIKERPQHAANKGAKDTLKADYELIPMPSGLDLRTSSYYVKKGVNEREHEKITRVDVLHQWHPAIRDKQVQLGEDGTKFKVLYSFTGKDSLAFYAIFSAVKYKNEYYLIVFPHHDEWMDFTPPEGPDGYFLYTPLAFHVDTAKWVLTRMTYNPKLKIDWKQSRRAPFYSLYNHPHQFDRPFTFSRKSNEFAFGKAMEVLRKNL